MSTPDRQFEILLLGPPQTRWQGKLFKLPGRQNRLLIYYLAASRKFVDRRSLENLIWPLGEQTDIGRQLRQALSRLRRGLPDRTLLIENKETLSLDWTRVYCDVGEFENLLSSCLRMAEDEQRSIPLAKSTTVEMMRKAVNLWQGTRLLQTIDMKGSPDLESWFIQLEYSLESGRRWLLERLSYHESASHRPLEALKLAQTALVGNELDENLHETILNLLLRSGQRSQARRHFEHMKKEFEQAGLQINKALELIGTQFSSPSRHGVRVKRNFDRNPPIRHLQPDKPPTNESQWRVYHPGDEPFIGRMIILDTLGQIAQRGGGVLVNGESGQGKTRLLKEFYAHLAPPPKLILAAGQPGESELPYHPLITALSHQVSPAEWLHLPVTWANYLTMLFPELLNKRAGLRVPSQENPDLVRSQLYRALSALFSQLAERQPDKRLVFVLDDAHWADEATLQALVYLHGHPPFNERSLIVLAARIEESTPGLKALSDNLGKNERFNVLRMHRLSEAAIAQLVMHYIHTEPSADFVSQLTKATGGNPLYIIEIMRDWLINHDPLNEGELAGSSSTLPMPEPLLELMQYRLRRLPENARYLLEMIAIMGGEIGPHRMNRLAAHMDWQNIHATMDQLILSGLISGSDNSLHGPATTSPGARFFFTHDKFREAALLSIPIGQQSLLHLQAATILVEELGQRVSDQAAVIAQHFEAAGKFPEAFHYWVQAAHQSLRLSAQDTTLRQYEHADSLLESCIEGVEDNDLYLLYRAWSNFLNTANDSAGLEKLSLRLNDLGLHFDRPILLGMSSHLRTVAAFTRNEIQSGLVLVQGHQQYMEQSGHPNALAEVYTLKGILLYMSGKISASKESLLIAGEIINRNPNKDEIAADQARMVQHEISLVETLAGKPAVGYEHAISALNALVGAGPPTITCFCHSVAALASYFMGELRVGMQHSQAGLAMAFSNNAMRGIGYLSLYLGLNQAALGDLDGSLYNLEIAEEFGRRYNRREIYSFTNRIRGDMFFNLGNFELAAQQYHLAYEENPDLFAATDYQIRLANAKMRLENDLNSETSQALRVSVHRLKEQALQSGLNLAAHIAAQHEMNYHVRRQDWSAVRALVAQEQPIVSENGLAPLWHYANLCLALAEHAEGQSEAARQRLINMAAWAKQSGYMWLEIMAIRELIRIDQQFKNTLPLVLAERMEELLSHLRENSNHELVKQAVEHFREQIKKEVTFSPKLGY